MTQGYEEVYSAPHKPSQMSHAAGCASGKTADAGRCTGDDQLVSVQDMVSRVQDAPGFYYTQGGDTAQRTRGIRHQSRSHKRGGGHRGTAHHTYLLEGPALARHRDPATKLSKAMNLVYNNQANIHNNMLMR